MFERFDGTGPIPIEDIFEMTTEEKAYWCRRGVAKGYFEPLTGNFTLWVENVDEVRVIRGRGTDEAFWKLIDVEKQKIHI